MGPARSTVRSLLALIRLIVFEAERVCVLVITNEPTENVVMAASFGKDGSLVSSVRNSG